MAHHPFSPSKLERIELCPGSYVLSQGANEKEEDAAIEGTLLHSFVEPDKDLAALTEEQKDLVMSCRLFVDELKARYPEVTHWEYESPVKLVQDFTLLTAGTADLVGVAPDYIVIADWKFGFKETTHAQENVQLLAYAASKMQALLRPLAEIHIYHPRLKFESMGRMDAQLLANTVHRIKKIRDTALDNKSLQLNPSEKACEYCKAKSICPAIKAQSLALATTHSSQVVNPAIMADLLTKAKMVKKWAESVEYHAKNMAFELGGLPGFKLRETKGHREIKDTQKAFNLICAYMAPEEFMAHCEVSVASLESAFIAKTRKDDPAITVIAAKSRFETLLLPVIDRKQSSKSLVAA